MNNYLFTGSEDKFAIQWNIETGKLIRLFEGHESVHFIFFINLIIKYVYSVIVYNNQLYTGSDDHKIRIWDVEVGEKASKVEHPTAGIFKLYV